MAWKTDTAMAPPTRGHERAVLALCVLCAAHCASRSAGAPSMSQSPIRVTTAIAQHDSKLVFRYHVENRGTAEVHLFDSRRMPYLIARPDGGLLVLHGVHPPAPNKNYNAIEVP